MPRSRISKRQLAAERVADHADWYRQDKNALRAWLAYRECRKHRLPVPEWVLRYFDRVAVKLNGWTIRQPPKKLAAALVRTVKMARARGTVFTDLKASDRKFALASLFNARLLATSMTAKEHQRAKVNEIAENVAKTAGVGRATVLRAVKDYKAAGFKEGRLSPE